MILRMKRIWSLCWEPIVIILVGIITYAPQIPWMGFVIDDWAYIDFYSFHGLDGLVTYTTLIDVRPFAFWIPWIGFKLFGTSPLPWQIWTLAWNILAALVIWSLLKRLFPCQRQQNLLVTLLFAVYPLFFTHITSALQLSVHAVCYFLIAISFYFTERALQQPKGWFWLTAAAVLTSFLQLFTLEYFAGLELARWLMIFYLVAKTTTGFLIRFASTLKQGLPYLLIWGFWAVWRVALMPRPAVDRNSPVLVQQLLHNPLAALVQIAQTVIQDTIQMLGGVWSRTYEYENFSFSPISNLAAWGIGLIVMAIIALALWKMPGWKEEKPYPWRVAGAGLVMVWLAFLPIWAIGERMAYFTVNADRYGMAAMIGAALVITSAAGLLLKNRLTQNIFLIIVIGLGASYQIHINGANRYSREKQQDFYWQLKWRAPQLVAPTALIGNGQLIGEMGDWFLTSAIDHLYAKERPSINPVYYYLDAGDIANPIFLPGTTTIATKRYQRFFKAEANQTIALQYEYGSKRCLWIVSEADWDNPYLSDFIKPYLKYSNLDRIQPGSDLPADLQAFGSSHPINWCYYYQKARLSEQMADWSGVLSLWTQAGEKGFAPRNSAEIIPFIRAAAMLGQWDVAQSLTIRANNPKEQMQVYLCRTWDGIEKQIDSAKAQMAGIRQQIDCK